MKSHKHTDHKAADKNHTPPRDAARDYHSASQKQVRDAKHDPHKSYTGGGPKVGKHGK